MNAVHIRRIESGGIPPSFSLFLKICNVFGSQQIICGRFIGASRYTR
ncbi:hypothetical protein [Ruminiclostridium cellobioparum]